MYKDTIMRCKYSFFRERERERERERKREKVNEGKVRGVIFPNRVKSNDIGLTSDVTLFPMLAIRSIALERYHTCISKSTRKRNRCLGNVGIALRMSYSYAHAWLQTAILGPSDS